MASRQAGSIAGGIGASQDAKAQKQAAQINSYIGRTRAMQTDTAAREGLSSELATMRATFAQNGQNSGVGTFDVMDRLRTERNRERRVDVGNRNQEAAQYRLQAQNAGSQSKFALLGGFTRAAQSLFDLHEERKKNG